MDLWGVEYIWFFVNGFIVGIVVVILVICGDGDKIFLFWNVY